MVSVVNGHLLWRLEDGNQSYAVVNHLVILSSMIIYKTDLVQKNLIALEERLNRKLECLQIDVSCNWQGITKRTKDDLRQE